MVVSNRIKTLAVIFHVITIVIGFFIAWDFIADDSFITFRYSKHLGEGNGIVFNATDIDPVEGYTNFLWMIVMAVPHALGWNPVLFSKIVGFFNFAGCALTLFLYARYKTKDGYFGYLAVLPLLILPSTYFHTVSGMETLLYSFMLLLLFSSGYELLTQSKLPSRWQIISVPVLILMAGMIRPEGILSGSIVLIVLFLSTKNHSRKNSLLYSGALLVVPGLVYFIWRVSYFGWLLPNTFYVKYGQPSDGIEWLLKSLSSVVGLIAIIILSYAFDKKGNKKSHKRFMYYAAFLIMAISPYIMSDLGMNCMNRFLFHILPVIFLIAAFEIRALFTLGNSSKDKIATSKGLMLVVILFSLLPLLHKDKTQVAHMTLYESHLQNAHIELAKTLKSSSVPQKLRTLAVGDAGAIPYYSEWQSYDFVGLNDEFTAHNPTKKTAYLKEKAPTVLILYAEDNKNIRLDQYGLEPHALMPEYNEIAFIKLFPNYYLAVFLRKDIDSSIYDELFTAINTVELKADHLNADTHNRIGLIKHLKKRIGL
ncbi:MAG: hypothetical protein KAR42_07180 [candidate division Zixibacteria bacterium]|nr:hypothetical protein [candidate division Zixibacteria bacterium]